MTGVEKARRLAKTALEHAAIIEETGELSNEQLLAKQAANHQLQLCDLFDCIAILQDRLDDLERQLTSYRMGEL